MSKSLAIVGSRNFTDKNRFNQIVDHWIEENGTPDTIITGDAKGVDELARQFAIDQGYSLIVHKADWKAHGRAAGPIRNKKIVADCNMMLAIPDMFGKGTQNSILQAKKAGIKPVIVPVELDII